MNEATAAGWYPDPKDPARLRRWDGAGWTHDTKPAPADAPNATGTEDPPASSRSWFVVGAVALVGLGIAALLFVMARGDATQDDPAFAGALRWTTDLRGDGRPDAVIGDGDHLVFFVRDSQGDTTQAVAFDVSTGAELWRESVVVAPGSQQIDRPVIIAGRVLVPVKPGEEFEIRALDAATGAEVWTTPFVGFAGLTVVDDKLIVPTRRDEVAVIDVASGVQLWTRQAGDDNRISLVARTPDKAVMAERDRAGEVTEVAAFDLDSGDELWRLPVEASVVFPVDHTQHADVMLITGVGQTLGIDPDRGEVIWQDRFEDENFDIRTLLEPRSGSAITCSVTGDPDRASIEVRDLATGALRFREEIETTAGTDALGPGPGLVGATGDALLVTSAGGGCGTGFTPVRADSVEIRALSWADGTELWSLRREVDGGQIGLVAPGRTGVVGELTYLLTTRDRSSRLHDLADGGTLVRGSSEERLVVLEGSLVSIELGSRDDPTSRVIGEDPPGPAVELDMVGPIPLATIDGLTVFVDALGSHVAIID